jgi:hypothetical protein
VVAPAACLSRATAQPGSLNDPDKTNLSKIFSDRGLGPELDQAEIASFRRFEVGPLEGSLFNLSA